VALTGRDIDGHEQDTPNPHKVVHRRVLGAYYNTQGVLDHYFVSWQAPNGATEKKPGLFDYRKFKTLGDAQYYYRTGKRRDRRPRY
jgi:hypothetical protein